MRYHLFAWNANVKFRRDAVCYSVAVLTHHQQVLLYVLATFVNLKDVMAGKEVAPDSSRLPEAANLTSMVSSLQASLFCHWRDAHGLLRFVVVPDLVVLVHDLVAAGRATVCLEWLLEPANTSDDG